MRKIFVTIFCFNAIFAIAQKPATPVVKPTTLPVVQSATKKAEVLSNKFSAAPKTKNLAAKTNDTIITKDATDLTVSHYVVKNSAGTVLAQGKLVKGLKEGLWRFYYDFGSPFKVEEYHLGKKNGVALTYDRSGYIQFDETYKNDELDGISIKYINGGKIKSQIEYKHGKVNGKKILNYDNGEHQEVSEWKNGEKNGTSKWYFQKNLLMMETEYKDGKMNGKSSTYNNTGKIAKSGTYLNDKENGDWQEYDEDGNVIKITIYKNGVVVSEKNITPTPHIDSTKITLPK